MVDTGDARLEVGFVQVDFGEDEVEGGGGLPDDALHLAPVLGLRGELIAGDHGPAIDVDAHVPGLRME